MTKTRNETRKDLGRKLAELRREKRLTQDTAAELLGVTRSSVTKWERGLATPRDDMKILLADLYGCEPEELMYYTITPKQPKKPAPVQAPEEDPEEGPEPDELTNKVLNALIG